MSEDIADFLQALEAAQPDLELITPTVIIPKTGKPLPTCYMRRQSGEDHWRLLTLQNEFAKAKRDRIPPAALVSWALVKADGTPQFEDIAEGFKTLAKIEKDALYELYDHALRLSGLGAKAVEDAEKKSSSSQSSNSGTSSPSSSEAAP